MTQNLTGAVDTDSFKRFAMQVERAAEELFAGREAAERIAEVCAQFRERCEQSFASRGLRDPFIAVVGLKGQGKSWVARAMVTDPQSRDSIPSGVLTREATTKVYWIGPQVPEGFDDRREVFVRISRSGMLQLGFDYTLLDTPGASDADAAAAAIAAAAVSVAPLILLVTRQDQLRSEAAGELAERTGGSIVVPIITAVSRDQQVESDERTLPTDETRGPPPLKVHPTLQARVERWREAVARPAANLSWLSPVYVEDFEESGDEDTARLRLAGELVRRLSGIRPEAIAQSRGGRLRELRRQLQHEVATIISQEAPDVAGALRTLQLKAAAVPVQAVEAVLGSPATLRLALQRQLRAWMVADTPAIFFPYRTVLSLLSLTHGAWDRVVLAMTGSLPSLFGSIAAATRNAAESQKSQEELRAGLQQRIDAQASAIIHPIYVNFAHALRRHSASVSGIYERAKSAEIRFRGTEQLQLRSAAILQEELDRCRPRLRTLSLTATVGTLLFWLLFAGPIVAIYRDYLAAAYQSLVSWDLSIEAFPAPPVQAFVTAIVLSLLPLAIYCMAVLTVVLSRRRVRHAVDRILNLHHRLINELQADDVLALEISDDQLSNARFLIGLQEEDGAGQLSGSSH